MHTRISSALAILACTFAFAVASAHAEDPATPPIPPPTPPAPTEESTPVPKPAARREDVEPKTLTDAKGALKSARDDRDAAESELTSERAAHDKTKQILKATLETCQAAQSDLATLKASLESITKERDALQSEQKKTAAHLTHLEALCNVKGIDAKNAVPAINEQAGGTGAASLYQQWQDLRKSDTAKAQAFYRKHKAELDAYGESQTGR